jgi:hypothetical protein
LIQSELEYKIYTSASTSFEFPIQKEVINVPRRKIHNACTLRKYGVTGDDIHEWTDELYQELGIYHRQERHHYDEWLPWRFIKKYGLHRAKGIHRYHVWLDNNWD